LTVAKRVQLPIFACLACVVALVALVLAAYALHPFEQLDAKTLIHLGAPLESRSYRAAEAFAYLGDPLPLLALLFAVCAFALAFGRRREALAAVAIVAGANLTTQVLKVLLAHPRYQPYPDFHQPWPTAFPSGHTTAAWSIAVALIVAAPARLRPLAVIVGLAFASLVSVSVIVLEWHFPSDVLGGILISVGWGCAAVAALRLTEPTAPPPQPAQPSSRFAISTK
jgi:membrane-associated phospholipid phosphatase